MKSFNFLHIEIAIEVAWQLGELIDDYSPRAEARWKLADIVKDIIDNDVVGHYGLYLDEIIGAYLLDRGLL